MTRRPPTGAPSSRARALGVAVLTLLYLLFALGLETGRRAALR